ncbi:MAG: metal-binding protein [Clostridia bacterium]|nr:metal-binding protein [Clostridia bacterium]
MSYSYFENKKCEYYPCHKAENINCLFCFCPLYHMEDCGGSPEFIETDGKRIKDCSNCMFPHRKENYEKIIEKIKAVSS